MASANTYEQQNFCLFEPSKYRDEDSKVQCERNWNTFDRKENSNNKEDSYKNVFQAT